MSDGGARQYGSRDKCALRECEDPVIVRTEYQGADVFLCERHGLELAEPNDQRAGAVAYDRELLVSVLVYHWPTKNNGCTCGWGVLGHSFPEHVADVYEQAVLADV